MCVSQLRCLSPNDTNENNRVPTDFVGPLIIIIIILTITIVFLRLIGPLIILTITIGFLRILYNP